MKQPMQFTSIHVIGAFVTGANLTQCDWSKAPSFQSILSCLLLGILLAELYQWTWERTR